MKKIIAVVNIFFGLAIIFNGFFYSYSQYKIATRVDFDNKIITFEVFGELCKNYQYQQQDFKSMSPCVWGDYASYHHAQKGISLHDKLEAQKVKSQLSTNLASTLGFSLLIGLLVIFSAFAFTKNKKWAMIVLIVLNFLFLLYLAFVSYALLFFGGVKSPVYFFSALMLILLVFEISFARNHWLELN